MKKPIRNKRCPKTAWVAVMTIVAVLVAPFCGTICAGSTGCVFNAVNASSGAEDCHHRAAPTAGDARARVLSSSKSCSQHELPLAILNVAQNLPSLHDRSSQAAHFFVAKFATRARHELIADRSRYRDDGELLPITRQSASTSVLRL